MKTQKNYRKFVVESIIPLIERKGKEYTGETQSAFRNFEDGADTFGMRKEEILMLWAYKQFYGIKEAIFTKRDEPMAAIRERILDCIAYLMMLLFMLEDK
jgi:hypothetical protein